jgi:hypothetical protein
MCGTDTDSQRRRHNGAGKIRTVLLRRILLQHSYLGDQITSYETYRRVHFVFLSTSAGTKAGWLDGAVPINHPGCVHGKGVWVDTSFRVMEEGWFAAAAGTWLSGQDIGP